MMRRHGHEGEFWGVVQDRGKRSEGRPSLKESRDSICWAEIWVSVLCGNPMVYFLLLIFARYSRPETLSVYLGCDYAFGLCAHGFWSDG